MTLNRLILGITIAFSLAGCNQTTEQAANCEQADSCIKFTILHTNDNHGRFWKNDHEEYGMSARKTLINRIRNEVAESGGSTLVFSGGDINTGVPQSALLDAEPDFIGMNDIAYDAMAVGNHEFDNSLDVLEKQRNWANFPMLAANIYDKSTNKRYFEPYKIFKVQGLNIAIVGLTTQDTAKIANPQYIQSIEFRNPTTELKSVIQELDANKKADLVFAVTHMGHYLNAMHGANAPGDVTLARNMAPGELDGIIGGHSQNPVCMKAGTNDKEYAVFKPGDACMPDRQNGAWIMQAYEWGKYVGRADFEYYNNELHLASYALVPVNLRKLDDKGERTDEFAQTYIPEDTALFERLEVFQKQGEQKLSEKLSSTNGKLDGERSSVRFKQTNLGVLVARAQSTGIADFGIVNGGGLRASIEKGDITYNDVLTVQPFSNQVALNTMKGSKLEDYLSKVATIQQDSGGYAQFDGIDMTVDCANQSVDIHAIDGKSYDAQNTYTFTVPDYNANGGDGYPKLNYQPTGNVDSVVLYDYLKAHPSIDTAQYDPGSHIVYINSSSNNGCAP
ncbi:bifunctional UDP-sugar hydrolase/5'-nucleotidase UshA [Vibrio zhugei]|uniref:Bifunctional UDP-sugar hydrolase/5'-nucleotidase UshA n=1 Tax=Vibrio zhugei TaxID=2479546 RepID=A0ABV7C2L8_9VIBR|nr:bifunctional UDP-sugar hydrolase/5'-nucleotidase UshA [Vibrio zhugei]